MNKYLFSLALIAFLIYGCNEHGEQELSLKIDSLKNENDSLKKLLTAATVDTIEFYQDKDDTIENYWFDKEFDGREFIERGIRNPENYIKNALLEKPELIPQEAILGGTMRFWNAQLLGDKWIIADFEDGHISGRAIYKYELLPDKKVKFKLITWSEN